MLPSTPESLVDEAAYDRANLLALRNTSLANVLDGCSVSLPIGNDTASVGFVLIGIGGTDDRRLSVARTLACRLA